MLYKYHLSGYIFECNYPLPELSLAFGQADCCILVKKTISQLVPAEAKDNFSFYDKKLKLLCVQKKSLGFVAVWDEKLLEYTPPPHFSKEEVKMNLLGSIYMIMASSLGYTALHAACVLVNDKAVLFCGTSGAGKSSLTAYFYKKGYPILSDDVTTGKLSAGAIPIVFPSLPRMKLSLDALTRNGISAEGLEVLPSPNLKYSLPTSPLWPETSYSLGAIIFPEFEDGQLRFDEIKGITEKKEIHQHLFRKQIASIPEFKKHISAYLFCLVGVVPMYNFKRAKNGEIDSFEFIEKELLKIIK